mmetsp:Transcript_18349/g.38479  ORF Transcript_18349/g.38479 Transcript_18349/m.38479 type:complete len:248 (-) Transcript_18349:2347-3090(-)
MRHIGDVDHRLDDHAVPQRHLPIVWRQIRRSEVLDRLSPIPLQHPLQRRPPMLRPHRRFDGIHLGRVRRMGEHLRRRVLQGYQSRLRRRDRGDFLVGRRMRRERQSSEGQRAGRGSRGGKGLFPAEFGGLHSFGTGDVGGDDEVGDDAVHVEFVVGGFEDDGAEFVEGGFAEGAEGDFDGVFFGYGFSGVEFGEGVVFVDQAGVGDALVVYVVDVGGEDEGEFGEGGGVDEVGGGAFVSLGAGDGGG